MKKVKRGETFEFIVEFDQDEWSALYPFQEIVARVRTGETTTYNLNVSVNADYRTIIASCDTDDWIVGSYKCDLLFSKNGKKSFIPGEDFFRFELVKSVSGEII